MEQSLVPNHLPCTVTRRRTLSKRSHPGPALAWPRLHQQHYSVALTTPRARVQRRPAFLPYSWKSSISALRPPPFFYHIFFLLDNEASGDWWRSEPRYGSLGRLASIKASRPGNWVGAGAGRRRVGNWGVGLAGFQIPGFISQ